MKTCNFPYIALGLGLLLMLIVMKGSEPVGERTTLVPLLTLLVVSEFAFFVTAIGGVIGIRHARAQGFKPMYMISTILCLLLAVAFMLKGIDLWPD